MLDNTRFQKIKSTHPLQSQNNGILRLYNQFPYFYPDIDVMRAQLKDISEMGFNAVWINPLQQTCKKSVVRYFQENKFFSEVDGSLYAMKSHTDFNPKFTTDGASDLKAYTHEAVELGIAPIFDLVLNHVAKDSPLVLGTHPEFQKQEIDTRNWFIIDPLWDDVCKFNYKDKRIAKEIIEVLWKPYIKKYIDEYGFMGVRVDAARLIPADVQKNLYDYVNECVQAKYGVPAIVFAEILYTPEAEFEEVSEKHNALGITHLTNDAYWLDLEARETWYDINQNFERNKQLSQQIVLPSKDSLESGKPVGGTVGFAGSHDENCLYTRAILALAKDKITVPEEKINNLSQQLEESNKNSSAPKEIPSEKYKKYAKKHLEIEFANALLTKREISKAAVINEMKKMIAVSAVLSDGGFYLMCGDEYGDTRRKNVFEIGMKHSEFSKCSLIAPENLKEFVTELNSTLRSLSSFTQPARHDRVHVKNVANCIVALRHTGDFSKPFDLILFQLSQDKLTQSVEVEDCLRQWANDHNIEYQDHWKENVNIISNFELSNPVMADSPTAGYTPSFSDQKAETRDGLCVNPEDSQKVDLTTGFTCK